MGLRTILHCDMNCFYASVEQHRNPALRGLPVVVAGDPERRNGIILAKSPEAKRAGIKTAEALWQAREKCPDLVVVPADYPAYLRYSKLARSIYYQYTNLVEPFGLDESWLDVTGSLHLFGNEPRLVAQEISERVKAELGLSISVGLSWNKVFAKFGSDTDPGDGIVEITPDNYRDKIWPAPAKELICIGPATAAKLHSSCIETVGDVANASDRLLQRRLGKMGGILKSFANGWDVSPVKEMNLQHMDADHSIKSIGNSLTAPHDLTDPSSAKALVYLLAESVAQRLRECRMRARTIGIHVRDNHLAGYLRQAPLPTATNITDEIVTGAFELLRQNEPLDESHPLRQLGVRALNLVSADLPVQEDLFGNVAQRETLERLDATIDSLRKRFGNSSVRRLTELTDDTLAHLDIHRDNVIHPIGYFGG